MKRCWELAMAAAIGLPLLSSCGEQKPVVSNANNRQTSANQQFAKIEKLSRESCLCKLSGRLSPMIDDQLALATRSLKVDRFGESSAPLAGSYDCYPELGERACVSQYYVVGAKNEPYICDLDQVKRLEAAWNSVSRADDPRGSKAKAAMMADLGRLKSDLVKSIPKSACK
jgi:hypothetical protein